jgi:hypothetical protein
MYQQADAAMTCDLVHHPTGVASPLLKGYGVEE